MSEATPGDRPAPPRTLVVLRHSKAEQVAATDFERPLLPRGRLDAADVGRWLAGRGMRPDVALVSAAARTRETWAELATGAGWDLEPTVDRGLYAAGADTVLDLVRDLDDTVTCVVVIGHNPTVAYLAALLDDGEGDAGAGNEMAMGYPTSAAAVFDLAGPWADLGPGTASLRAFHVGRG